MPVLYWKRESSTCEAHKLFTRMTLVCAGISCRRVSVHPSVTSQCSTETAKRGIAQTVPRDSPGTLVS